MYWKPTQHLAWLFGIVGAVILLAYFGILWSWIRTYSTYEGNSRIGRHIQLLGYTILVALGNLLCMYFGNPKQIALVNLPLPSAESINITLGFGMLLLFIGHYIAARGSKEVIAS
jgi:hypothetical protein